MPDDATPAPTAPRAALLVVFLVVFIDLLGFGIVLPLLPRYAKSFARDLPIEWVGLLLGVIYSSFSAMQFIFAPIWGRLSDRTGRRPILLLGLLGSVIFYTLFAFASDLSPEQGTLALILLLVARTGAGIAGATIATAQAVIADCTTREKRSGGMALIGAAFGIGFTFGPLIAYAAVRMYPNWHGAPGYLAAILSLLSLLIAVRKMPETRTFATGPTGHRQRLPVRSLLDTLKMPTIGLAVLTFFLGTFAFAEFESTLSILTKETLDYGEDDNFLVFAFVGFVLMLTTGYIYRKVIKKLDEIACIRIGIVTMFLGLLGLGGIAYAIGTGHGKTAGDAFYPTLAVCVFGFAFLNPSIQALISKRSDPDRQGEVLGVNQSFSALARILGPLTGLSLFYVESTHVLPYAVGVVLLGIVLVLLPGLKRA